MQTVTITGAFVPDPESSSSQLSSRTGEGFALYFEKAGQVLPTEINLVLPEHPSDVPSEDTEPEMPAPDEFETGQVPFTETKTPASSIIVKASGNTFHTASNSINKSKAIPPSELRQTFDSQPLSLHSNEGTEASRTSVGTPEPGQSNPPAATPALKNLQGGTNQSRSQNDHTKVNRAMAALGTALSENRAATSKLSFPTGAFSAANGLPPIEWAANVSANRPLDPAGAVKSDVLADAQNTLQRRVSPLIHPAGAVHATANLEQDVGKARFSLEYPIPAPGAQVSSSSGVLADGLPRIDANSVENPGRSITPPALEYPVSGAASVPSNHLDIRMGQSGFMSNGNVEAAALQKASSQQILDTEVEFADTILSPQSKVGTQPVSTQSYEAMLTRPETARMVAAQMSEALIRAQSNKVGIALNPKELGRVRMVLSTSDTGISISITAERPETLDLMRRHIDQLAEEFHNLGYTDIGFEFSGGDARGQFDRESADNPHGGLTQSAEDPNMSDSDALPPARATPSRGLDLRL